MERIDAAVLATLGGEVLRPAIVEAVIDGVLEALRPAAVAADVQQLRIDLQATDRACARLTAAIAAGGDLPALLEALSLQEARRVELAARIGVRQAAVVTCDRAAIQQTVRERLAGWRALLTKHVADGRQLLREVLLSPLRFTPERRSYRFEGEAALGRLLAGVVDVAPLLASPTGIVTLWYVPLSGIMRQAA